MDIFHLLGYVSLNMAGFRKMLKKYAKNVEPSKPQPGELLMITIAFKTKQRMLLRS